MTARQISLASTAGHTALFRLFQQAADGTPEPSCNTNVGRGPAATISRRRSNCAVRVVAAAAAAAANITRSAAAAVARRPDSSFISDRRPSVPAMHVVMYSVACALNARESCAEVDEPIVSWLRVQTRVAHGRIISRQYH